MKSFAKILVLTAIASAFIGCSGGDAASNTPVKTDSTQVRAEQTGTNTVEAKE
jgi:hypothetical protein